VREKLGEVEARMDVTGSSKDLADRISDLPSPVRLVFFSQTFGCDSCFSARRVIDQVADFSEKISVDEHNFVLDTDQVTKYGIEQVPALVVVEKEDLGIRYYGVPSGYEIESIVHAVEVVSGRAAPLSTETLNVVAVLDRPVHIRVFVTPT